MPQPIEKRSGDRGGNQMTKRFDVALSFPGEHRDFVEEVAVRLSRDLTKDRVLYDKYYEAEFARLDLDVYLPKLYRTESELVVIFLCPEYKKKRWCRLEWRHIKQLIATDDEGRIMLVSFGDPGDMTEIGVLPGDGYLTIGRRTPEEIARFILERLGRVPQGNPLILPSSHSPQIAPTRLPCGADHHLFGRENEITALDQAWNDSSTHVLAIVAWGGVGKTSLVVEWMARKAAEGWPGFERVFDWTFYSQGTREKSVASSDSFITAAFEFFGDPEMAKSEASPRYKGARLARLVAERPTLLVLDGLEPLQDPPGPTAGKLKDPALATLLKSLAQRNPGLCVITTRERVADLASFRSTTAPEWDLDKLSEEAGSDLLKSLLEPERPRGARNVKSTDAERREIARVVRGHALTLQLLGKYIQKALGDVRRWREVNFMEADAKIQGGHAFKMMMAYEKWFAGAGEDGARSLAILRLLGLFDRPADAGCLSALRREPAIPGLTEPLVGLAEEDWNITLSSLIDCRLASIASPSSSREEASWCEESTLDTHPLIREYFAKQLREKNPEGWRAAHHRLFEHLKDSTEYRPDTLEGLQPLYQAVVHGCLAELYQEAFEEVFWRRILNAPPGKPFLQNEATLLYGILGTINLPEKTSMLIGAIAVSLWKIGLVKHSHTTR
jgi:hypothetical protein